LPTPCTIFISLSTLVVIFISLIDAPHALSESFYLLCILSGFDYSTDVALGQPGGQTFSTCAVKTSEVFVGRFKGRIQLEIAPGIAGQSAFETSEVWSIAVGSGLTAQVEHFESP
jgi:hypothetical protein